MFPEMFRYHVAGPVNDFINNLIEAYGPVFDSISHGILSFLLGVNSVLSFIPWWAYIGHPEQVTSLASVKQKWPSCG